MLRRMEATCDPDGGRKKIVWAYAGSSDVLRIVCGVPLSYI